MPAEADTAGSTTEPKKFRILSLDGGGAKGIYTLGVLKEIEGMIGGPVHERFDLVFGTSTGAIIAALVCLGRPIDEIHELYRNHVIEIMRRLLPSRKSQALHELSSRVFEDKDFTTVKTDLGIVTTKWDDERPMIFKSNANQAYTRKATFVPGFGSTIAEAVEASCSAYPFFRRKLVHTADKGSIELADGGYCANNPTLYAISDAVEAIGIPLEMLRVVSIGVGEYPKPKYSLLSMMRWIGLVPSAKLVQKVLEINTQSMEQLREVLFRRVPTIRISETFKKPELATDMFEHNPAKLEMLWRQGRDSFAKHEPALREFFQ
jgi:patatin-like phospholipase/acyl hydrolase